MDVILSGAKDVLSRESGFTVSRTPRCRQLHEVGHGGAPNAPKDIRGRRTTARTRRRTLRTCSMLVSAPCPTNPDLFLWDTRSGRHEKRPERRSFKSFWFFGEFRERDARTGGQDCLCSDARFAGPGPRRPRSRGSGNVWDAGNKRERQTGNDRDCMSLTVCGRGQSSCRLACTRGNQKQRNSAAQHGQRHGHRDGLPTDRSERRESGFSQRAGK